MSIDRLDSSLEAEELAQDGNYIPSAWLRSISVYFANQKQSSSCGATNACSSRNFVASWIPSKWCGVKLNDVGVVLLAIFDHLIFVVRFSWTDRWHLRKSPKVVPEALDQVSAANIRRYFRRCFRYMDACMAEISFHAQSSEVTQSPKPLSNTKVTATISPFFRSMSTPTVSLVGVESRSVRVSIAQGMSVVHF
jgi:hypothetical protein